MTLYRALNKISKRRRSESFYNSDYILTAQEKQSLLILGFMIIFPVIIATIVFLTN